MVERGTSAATGFHAYIGSARRGGEAHVVAAAGASVKTATFLAPLGALSTIWRFSGGSPHWARSTPGYLLLSVRDILAPIHQGQSPENWIRIVINRRRYLMTHSGPDISVDPPITGSTGGRASGYKGTVSQTQPLTMMHSTPLTGILLGSTLLALALCDASAQLNEDKVMRDASGVFTGKVEGGSLTCPDR